ncbi:MAG TPA: NAD(P)H-dependent oxidoreductase [Mesorhizobium sp.]|jgi:NAD(P)H-dependent FMN reductase|nr:NAD(P)H-dependent oxidoreductase [Mesorhizobium sp.]
MNDQIRIALILGSAREGRFCDTVAGWTQAQIDKRPEFTVDLIDPAELKLASSHGGTEKEVQQDLKHRLEAADAFVVVTPEYNHGYPAALKALIDSAYSEWQAKPVAFVSYGGISGGLRAVEQLRQVFAELHAVTVRDGVSFAHPWNSFSPDGQPLEPGAPALAADVMLTRLKWWALALRAARQHSPYGKVAA